MDAVRYAEPATGVPGRVWINKTQYFDNVPPEVWGYHIGGYRVCQKWLKDRKGRQLSYDDLTHYRGIVAALARTIGLQAAIDEAIGSRNTMLSRFTETMACPLLFCLFVNYKVNDA